MNLDKIHFGFMPSTGEICLCRYGKNPELLLDKREVTSSMIHTVIKYMTHNTPGGSSREMVIDGQKYKLSVTPVEERPS